MKNINFTFYVMFFYLNLFNNINSNTYLFNSLNSTADNIINIYNIIFLSALNWISIVLFVLSYILIINDRFFLIDVWIMHYVKKLLEYIFNTNSKILYKRLYKITHTHMDNFLKIFSILSRIYIFCIIIDLIAWATNNFTIGLTYTTLIVVIIFTVKSVLIQSIIFYFFMLIIYLMRVGYILFIYYYPNYKWKNTENPLPEINFIRNSLYRIPRFYTYWLGLFFLCFSIVIFIYSIQELNEIICLY